MDEIEDRLYRGALLHDIGKFWQRSGETAREKHQLLSTKFIKEWLEDDIVAHIVANHHKTDWKKAKEDSLRHRLALIVCEADSLASKEREKSHSPYIRPMDSIFNNIRILNMDGPVHHIQPHGNLSAEINKYNFPRSYDKSAEQDKAARKIDQHDSWNAFTRELAYLEEQGGFEEIDADTLLYLYKKHLWCVPSAYFFQQPDISLYDHSRMTAAIAVCLYRSLQIEYGNIEALPFDDIENRKAERYLLVGGGFSGVQKYLYGIAHKGALKGLKGRSFWLNQAIDSIARDMLDQFQMPEANLIYANGGRFYALLPSYLLKEVKEFRNNVEKYIQQEDEKNLGLEFGFIELSGEELGTPVISERWHALNENLVKSKLQKLESQWNEVFFAPGGPGGRVVQCQFTKRDLCTVEEFSKAVNSGRKVEMGYTQYKVGEADIYLRSEDAEVVPENERAISAEQYRGQVIGKQIRDDSQVIGFQKATDPKAKGFFSVLEIESLCFLKEVDAPKENLNRIAWLNDDDFMDYQPNAAFKRVWKFYGGNWVLKNSNKELKEFEDLAKEAMGIKRLAILRMDVDNLGLVFKEGFGEKASFSRIAQLSTMLDFFFCGYLNQLKNCYWKAKLGVISSSDLSEKEKKAADMDDPNYFEVKSLEKVMQIVYAGGDDIFIIGLWNVIPDVAIWIQEQFQKFTIHSPSFTLSGGISLFRAKYPMYKAARRAGDAEEDAKNYERIEKDREVRKNAIALLGDVVGWDELKTISSWVKKLYSWIRPEEEGKQRMDKSIINKLAKFYADYAAVIEKSKEIIEKAEKEQKISLRQEATEKALWSRARWQAAYTLQRFAGQNKAYQEEVGELKNALFLEPMLIKKLGILTQWVDLLTREIKEGNEI
ncbi:MAG: type III-A CRISPR-associated protein Cas10/Csm1 [Lewinellaceae bacterium]|nr:type III-A CRISPR-associated protein Cas10/Csm1 [Lewinellaceae bacterium]